MIEIQFMTGNERHMPLPPYAKATGLTERFTVLQDNTFAVRVPDTTFDEALWRALLGFLSHYDPSASITVAENAKDVGHNERSLSDYMAHWATLDDDRDPPQVVSVRTASGLRLCMVTEYYYLAGGHSPYGDACVYALYADRDIGAEVMAFLRAQADPARWRFDDTVLRAEDMPAPPRWQRLKSVALWGLLLAGTVLAATLWPHLFGA